jgi:hypothetical protein
MHCDEETRGYIHLQNGTMAKRSLIFTHRCVAITIIL